MTLNITVENFEKQKVDENNTVTESGTLKQSVSLKVIDSDIEGMYIATKWLTISDSKTDEDYVKEAYDAIKDDITTWQSSKKNIGKTFNPDTGKME
tara:strand:+ start:944 stop:1231 length:288 start_codon:yes stop_codon:yes gene_type:complete